MRDPLAPVIAAVGRIAPDLDATDIADLLWLAAHMPRQPTEGRTPRTEVADADSVGEPTDPPVPPERPADGKAPVFDAPAPDETPVREGGAGRRLTVTRASALAERRELIRALRPLRRRWPTGRRRRLDLPAMVERYGATGLLAPMFRPAPEPWFDLTLLVDASASMVVWNAVTDELTTLFRQVGAHPVVRRWGLRFTEDGVEIRDQHGDPQQARHLLPPHRRTMVVVVSDCLADGWHHPEVWQQLRSWGTLGPVSLINPLPTRIWRQTALDLPASRVAAAVPGAGNLQLEYRLPAGLAAVAPRREWLPLPASALTPHALGRWAAMLMNGDPAGCDALLIPPQGRYPTEPVAPAEAGSDTAYFQRTVSPEALRLAVLCTPYAQFSMALLELIRAAVVPEATTADVAEVLAGGALTATGDADNAVLRFRPGIRERLRPLLTARDAWRSYDALSAWVAETRPAAPTFTVVVDDPTGPDRHPAGATPFAGLVRQILDQTGTPTPADLSPRLDELTALLTDAPASEPDGPARRSGGTTSRPGETDPWADGTALVETGGSAARANPVGERAEKRTEEFPESQGFERLEEFQESQGFEELEEFEEPQEFEEPEEFQHAGESGEAPDVPEEEPVTFRAGPPARSPGRDEWRVRILGSDGRVCGGGVLVTPDLIVTSAQVVIAAAPLHAGASVPRASVRVDFPALDEVIREARVAAGGWLPAAPSGSGDLAVLQLRNTVDAQPATIGETETANDAVRVHGHPLRNPEGVWVHATVYGPGGRGGLVQLQSRAGTPGIGQGFAGCGVVDAETGAVIGIVIGADDSGNAWMQPMERAFQLPALAPQPDDPDYADELLAVLLSLPGIEDQVNGGHLVDEIERDLDRPFDFTPSGDVERDLDRLLYVGDPEDETLEALARAVRRLYPDHPSSHRFSELILEHPPLLRDERQRLIRVLGRLHPDLVTRSVHNALGPSEAPRWADSADLGTVVDELARMGRPLLLFLLRVAEHSEPSAADELREHFVVCARRLGLADREIDRLQLSAPYQAETPYRQNVVVEVSEHIPDPERYLLTVWLPHYARKDYVRLTDNDNRPFRITEVPEMLGHLISDLVLAGPEVIGELTIEFVVPDTLLSHPFDQWHLDSAGFFGPLGMRYPVVLRGQDLKSSSWAESRRRRRWSWLQSNGRRRSAVSWLRMAAFDDRTFLARLRTPDDHPACVVLCGRPADDTTLDRVIRAVRSAGVPAVLWCRDDRPADRFEAETRAMLDGQDLRDLPRIVQRFRQDAALLLEPARHVGSQLCLLWEDPDRPTGDTPAWAPPERL